MSKKPIAAVFVLANGPTHTLRLPVAGVVEFVPGKTVKVFDASDLAYVKRAFPSEQMRLREFARSVDAFEAVPAEEPADPAPAEAEAPKGKRSR